MQNKKDIFIFKSTIHVQCKIKKKNQYSIMQNNTCKMKNWPKRSHMPQQIIAVCHLELFPQKKLHRIYVTLVTT